MTCRVKFTAFRRGLCWVGGEKAFSVLLRFAVGVTLARILTPGDYGLVGMMSLFVALGESVVDGGMANAVINKVSSCPVDVAGAYYRAGFRYNLTMALAVVVVLAALAPAVAKFYAAPVLARTLPVMGLSILIGALSSMQVARLTVELRFAAQSLANVLGTLAGGAVALALAWRGAGVWALVMGAVCASAGRTLVVWWAAGRRLLPVGSRESDVGGREWRELWRFGWRLTASYLLGTLHAKASQLVVGRFFGKSETGLFGRAGSFPALPVDLLTATLLKVAYPRLLSARDDARQLRRGYLRLLALAAALVAPTLALMAALAEPMVRLVVGERWLACVPCLRILCLVSLGETFVHLMRNVFYVTGRTERIVRLDLVERPVALVALFVSAPFGLVTLCWTMVATEIFSLALDGCCFWRETGAKKFVTFPCAKRIPIENKT